MSRDDPQELALWASALMKLTICKTMDEPTVTLSHAEAKAVLAQVQQISADSLAAKGIDASALRQKAREMGSILGGGS